MPMKKVRLTSLLSSFCLLNAILLHITILDIVIETLSIELNQLKQLIDEFKKRESMFAEIHSANYNESNQQSSAEVNQVLAQKGIQLFSLQKYNTIE